MASIHKALVLVLITAKTKQETKGEESQTEIPSATVVAGIVVGLWTMHQAH